MAQNDETHDHTHRHTGRKEHRAKGLEEARYPERQSETMKMTRLQYGMTEIHAVDSDTLTAWVNVSTELRQLWRIRLRGIEGGEFNTPEGMRAKALLERTLAELCTPDVARRWGFRMNMDLECFASLFRKATV